MPRESPLLVNTHVQPECIESLVCPRTERACTQPLLLGKGTNGLIEISLGAENVFVKWPLAFTTEGYLQLHKQLFLVAQTTLACLFFFTVDPDVVKTLSPLPGTFAPEVFA